MLERCFFSARFVVESDPAHNPIGTVLREANTRIAILVSVLNILYRITQCARRTLLDSLDYLLDTGTVGVDPWFDTHLPYCGESVGAKTAMRADAAVVVDRDLLTHVVFAVIPLPLGRFGGIESDLDVCAVAVGHAFGLAASTERHGGIRRQALAVPVG